MAVTGGSAYEFPSLSLAAAVSIRPVNEAQAIAIPIAPPSIEQRRCRLHFACL